MVHGMIAGSIAYGGKVERDGLEEIRSNLNIIQVEDYRSRTTDNTELITAHDAAKSSLQDGHMHPQLIFTALLRFHCPLRHVDLLG